VGILRRAAGAGCALREARATPPAFRFQPFQGKGEGVGGAFTRGVSVNAGTPEARQAAPLFAGWRAGASPAHGRFALKIPALRRFPRFHPPSGRRQSVALRLAAIQRAAVQRRAHAFRQKGVHRPFSRSCSGFPPP